MKTKSYFIKPLGGGGLSNYASPSKDFFGEEPLLGQGWFLTNSINSKQAKEFNPTKDTLDKQLKTETGQISDTIYLIHDKKVVGYCGYSGYLNIDFKQGNAAFPIENDDGYGHHESFYDKVEASLQGITDLEIDFNDGFLSLNCRDIDCLSDERLVLFLQKVEQVGGEIVYRSYMEIDYVAIREEYRSQGLSGFFIRAMADDFSELYYTVLSWLQINTLTPKGKVWLDIHADIVSEEGDHFCRRVINTALMDIDFYNKKSFPDISFDTDISLTP